MSSLRYAIRMIFKNRTFSAIAILTLALGIGANTAIFSIINTVLLKPFTYRNADQIMTLWETVQKKGPSKWRVAPANFLDWKQQSTQFEQLSAFGATTMNLTGVGEPEQLNGVHVTEGYFHVLGIDPVLGRSFLPEEHLPGKERVVILSNDLWKRRFGGEANITGQKVLLDEYPYVVIGVMPDGIYPGWPQVSGAIEFKKSFQQFWIPSRDASQWKLNRRSHVLGVIGRLKADTTPAQAQSEMSAISHRLEKYPENEGEGILVSPLTEEVVGNVRPALLMLLGTVGFVLLIACANVSSLLLTRLASRRRELSIRAALGATRMHLFRQFLMEGLLLVFFGGVIGLWLSNSSIRLLIKLIPQQIPRFDQIETDPRVFAFTLLLCLATSFLLGLIMAFHSLAPDLMNSLKQASRSSTESKGGRRFQQFLVVAQLSMAILLVLGAGLLIRSFWRLQQVDPGFNPDNLLVATIVLPESRYSDLHQINNFYSLLIERIQNLPGVRSAAIAYDHPLESNWINSFEIEESTNSHVEPEGRFIPVGPDYFRTAGISILKGRPLTNRDAASGPGVVIVNEALVRRFFPNESPIGKHLGISPPSYMWGKEVPESFEIVGVVRDVKFLGLETKGEPAFYVSALQSPLLDMKLLIRTYGDPLIIVSAVRKTVRSIDSNQPIASVSSMTQIVAVSLAGRRFNMVLMTLFGWIALMLASIGVYGLFSYTVTLQTSEIGVRLALGAKPKDILRMVMGHGLTLIVAGSAIGLSAAGILTRYLESQLYGISATDPVSFAAVTLLLAAISLLACYVPARRAMRVDPLVALRYE